MPTPVDNLSNQSSEAQARAAVTECIAYHIKNEGLTQEQAAGKCFGMAREKTGLPLEQEGG